MPFYLLGASDPPAMIPPMSDTVQDRLDDVDRRLREHPGYCEHLRCRQLARTLDTVFMLNLRELQNLLDLMAHDQALGIEMIQNVRRPDVRERYESEVTQRLHNHVAGSATLIDHARALMRNRTGSISDEFAKRTKEANSNPELPFIKDLRNFVLHKAHPFLAHTVNLGGEPGGRISGELELSVPNLLGWKGWKAPARAFIERHEKSIVLRPVIDRHGKIMFELHAWLHNSLAAANKESLTEANQLAVERNAILGNVDMATAARITDEVTKRRESPNPPPRRR